VSERQPADIRTLPNEQPGRNDPCYCGSGRKYKKCHLDPDREAARAFQAALPKLAERQRREAVMKETLRRDYSVYINFALPVQWDGGKAWAIGSRLYAHRPARETFHEFLISLLRETFSEEWRQRQVALPDDQQHFLLKCSNEWATFKERNSAETAEDGLFAATANGWVQYLVSLAWDIGTLIHTMELPAALVERLKSNANFQGARYEVAVAAIFARLDCEIAFLDDNEWRHTPHPEFIATHRPTGERVAVEAKSRHRPGVINDAREVVDGAVVRGDVQSLLRKAIPKAMDDLPFAVFLDVNAPPALSSGRENHWQADVKKWVNKMYADPEQAPQPVSAIAVTNFAPHYDGDDLAQGVEWLYFRPPNPVVPVDGALAAMLRQALDQYHRVPEISEDGLIRR
jgi:hypothetical protein